MRHAWIIRIEYQDGRTSYVLQRYCRAEGRTTIVPPSAKDKAERFVSQKAAESWFFKVREHWHPGQPYNLVAERIEI